MPVIDAWHEFFVAAAGASAVLLGLTFLGVSVHLERTTSHANLIQLAVSSTVPLYYSVLVSLVMLAPPAQPLVPTGAVLLLGIVRAAVSARPIVDSRVRQSLIEHEGRRSMVRHVTPWLAALALVVAAVAIAALPGPGLYALAAVVLIDLALGTQNAFDVLLFGTRSNRRTDTRG